MVLDAAFRRFADSLGVAVVVSDADGVSRYGNGVAARAVRRRSSRTARVPSSARASSDHRLAAAARGRREVAARVGARRRARSTGEAIRDEVIGLVVGARAPQWLLQSAVPLEQDDAVRTLGGRVDLRGHHRPARARGAARAACGARPADRAGQPRPLRGTAATRPPSAAPARVGRSRCSRSTSTTSRAATTSTATRRATVCWSPSRTVSGARPADRHGRAARWGRVRARRRGCRRSTSPSARRGDHRVARATDRRRPRVDRGRADRRRLGRGRAAGTRRVTWPRSSAPRTRRCSPPSTRARAPRSSTTPPTPAGRPDRPCRCRGRPRLGRVHRTAPGRHRARKDRGHAAGRRGCARPGLPRAARRARPHLPAAGPRRGGPRAASRARPGPLRVPPVARRPLGGRPPRGRGAHRRPAGRRHPVLAQLRDDVRPSISVAEGHGWGLPRRVLAEPVGELPRGPGRVVRVDHHGAEARVGPACPAVRRPACREDTGRDERGGRERRPRPARPTASPAVLGTARARVRTRRRPAGSLAGRDAASGPVPVEAGSSEVRTLAGGGVGAPLRAGSSASRSSAASASRGSVVGVLGEQPAQQLAESWREVVAVGG